TNNATLVFNRNNALTVASRIFGTGAINAGVVDPLNPVVTGSLFLTGTNAYSGNTSVNGNGTTLAVGTDTALGTGALVFHGNCNDVPAVASRCDNLINPVLTNSIIINIVNTFIFIATNSVYLVFNVAPLIATSGAKTLVISNANTTINNAVGSMTLIKDG